MSSKGHSPDFEKKILEQVKKLSDDGKTAEADALYSAYFVMTKEEKVDHEVTKVNK